jgi:hypothetical protein
MGVFQADFFFFSKEALSLEHTAGVFQKPAKPENF